MKEQIIQIKQKIHEAIAAEKGFCLRSLDRYFRNYIKTELTVTLVQIVEKEVNLTIKERIILSLPRIGDGQVKRSQDEILKKYSDLIFPKYEDKLREWIQNTFNKLFGETELRVQDCISFLVSNPNMEAKIRQRCMEIVIYIMAPYPTVSYIPNYEPLYKAFHNHIITHSGLSTSFEMYVVPEIKIAITERQTNITQEIGKQFDKFEKIVLETIDEQQESESN